MNSKSSSTSVSVRRTVTAVSAVAGIIAAVGAVIYACAYKRSYDPIIHHYERGSALITVSAVLLFAALVCSVLPSVKLRKKYSLSDSTPSGSEILTYWLCAFMFIGFGIISVTEGYGADTSSAVGRICAFLEAPVSILSALPFICSASEKLRCGIVHRITSFFPVVWGICQIFKYYFDLSEIPLNDPELAITVTVVSSVVLFFLSESRNAMLTNSPAICSFASLAAVCFAGTISCARIILCFTDSLAFPSIMENVMLFCIALSALTRICALPSRITEKSAEETEQEKKLGKSERK